MQSIYHSWSWVIAVERLGRLSTFRAADVWLPLQLVLRTCRLPLWCCSRVFVVFAVSSPAVSNRSEEGTTAC